VATLSDQAQRLKKVWEKKRDDHLRVMEQQPTEGEFREWAAWQYTEMKAEHEVQNARLAFFHQLYLDHGWLVEKDLLDSSRAAGH
jgi:hypothetical protein